MSVNQNSQQCGWRPCFFCKSSYAVEWSFFFNSLNKMKLSILSNLYLNDYAEFDSKISYIMFLHTQLSFDL